jgi:uncharacterized membrane protein
LSASLAERKQKGFAKVFSGEASMSDKTYVVYAASYASTEDAKADLEALKAIKSAGEIRDLTAAIVSKNDKGHLHVHETTHAGKVAAGVGIVAGTIIGAVFLPAGIAVVTAAVGGAAGVGVVAGAIGHFAGGISRKDMKELGEFLDAGEAAMLAVAVDAIDTDIDAALTRATKKASRAVDKGDVSSAIADLEKGLDKAANIAGE